MSVLSFCFESTPIRTLGDSLNPLFVAIDIAKALGFQKPSNAIAQHVDPEDLSKEEITDSMNRKQLVNCVNESGMYALIFGSKLPSAKRFKKWVTSEVLPTIRKTGQYVNDGQPTVTPAQQLAIREAISKRCRDSGKHYQAFYAALYARFKIARYDQLPMSELKAALEFIRDVDLSVPTIPMPDHGMPVSRIEAKNLMLLKSRGEMAGHLATKIFQKVRQIEMQRLSLERQYLEMNKQYQEMMHSFAELNSLQSELCMVREMSLITGVLGGFFDRFERVIEH